jgi:hypothetical protein
MNNRGLAQLACERECRFSWRRRRSRRRSRASASGTVPRRFALTREGLDTAAADSAPADGDITVSEWFSYAAGRVPELQLGALIAAAAQDARLRFAPSAAPPLQTPRVFAKEVPGLPFIIGKR